MYEELELERNGPRVPEDTAASDVPTTSWLKIVEQMIVTVLVPRLWEIPIGIAIVSLYTASTPIHGWGYFHPHRPSILTIFLAPRLGFQSSTELNVFQHVTLHVLCWSCCGAVFRHVKFGPRGSIGNLIMVLTIPPCSYAALVAMGVTDDSNSHIWKTVLVGFLMFTVINACTYFYAMPYEDCKERTTSSLKNSLSSTTFVVMMPGMLLVYMYFLESAWFKSQPILGPLISVACTQMVAAVSRSMIARLADQWSVEDGSTFSMMEAPAYVVLEILSKLASFTWHQPRMVLFVCSLQECAEVGSRLWEIWVARPELVRMELEAKAALESYAHVSDELDMRRTESSAVVRVSSEARQNTMRSIRIRSAVEVLAIVSIPVVWHVLQPETHTWVCVAIQIEIGLVLEVLGDVFLFVILNLLDYRPQYASAMTWHTWFFATWMFLAMLFALTFKFYL